MTNGCVTFDVGQSGFAWPYFLELIADPMGAGIAPCGRFTDLGAGVPGFYGSNAPNGDGPCLLPGNATSTTQSSFQHYLATVGPGAWDAFELLAYNYPSPQPSVQWNMVGSGPYYSPTAVNPTLGYFLKANPAYRAPQGCAGQSGCLPLPGNYDGTVNVYWGNSDQTGIQQMIAGQADTAVIDPTHFSTALQLVSKGTYDLLQNLPTLSVFFYNFEFNFSATAESGIDSTGLMNIPADFFSNVAVRQFIANAMPYTTSENSVFTSAGIQTGVNYGGVIPRNMGNYYPSNISWPYGDPVSSPSTPGNVTWWWNQAITSGSPYYDLEAVACTTGHPCKFPVISIIGTPTLDNEANLLISSISRLSGGDLQPYLLDIAGSTLAGSTGFQPGQGNMPFYPFGWAPDYPDPADYIGPMYGANTTYTYTDAVTAQVSLPKYNDSAVGVCGRYTTDLTNFSTLVYWANIGFIPNKCQGIAYWTMVNWATEASHLTSIPQRELDYNLIEHIANELALYLYYDQALGVNFYGSWINPAGINTNSMIGGGGDQLWAFWGTVTNTYTATFNETNLPASTPWSVTLGGVTHTSTTASITFPGQVDGTYPYTVGFVGGYGATPANGTVRVNGKNTLQNITFAALTGTLAPVYFNETGLVTNTSWTVAVTGVGAVSGNGSSLEFNLSVGTRYGFGAQPVPEYQASAGGFVTPLAGSTTVNVTYQGILFSTYTVTFASSGLPGGQAWSVTMGAGSTGAYTIRSTGPNITFTEANGTYRVKLTAPAGVVPPATIAQIDVDGANVVVPVPLLKVSDAFAVTFSESGLPPLTLWNVTIDDLTVTSTTRTLKFELANGTHNWSVVTIGGYTTSNWSGRATVAGAPSTVTLTFVLYTYVVTFYEGGLASGAAWNVSINGQVVNSTSYFLTVLLPNGTFGYSVGAPSGYAAVPATGSLTVAAANTTTAITFGVLYVVTFSTRSLPSGLSWTVYLGGTNVSGKGGYLNLTSTNGNWTFSIVPPKGYTAIPSGGTVSVDGAGATVPVKFVAIPSAASPSSTYLSPLAEGLIGGLVVLAALGFVLALRRPRVGSTSPPPQGWSGSGSTSGPSTEEEADDDTGEPPRILKP